MLTTLAVALSLTVPYLPQTDALCGGAAAAMVFRYWGDTHAGVDQFEPLVDKRAGGIADDVLIRAIEDGGWRPRRFVGSLQLLAEQIENKRPVLILLADRPPLNHYLVVTGIDAEAVIVHDPSWGPARRIPFADFMRVWQPTNFWALEILPPEKNDAAPASALDVPIADTRVTDLPALTACDRLLNDAVERARATPADAFAVLDAVRVQCPGSAGPLREMAGVRFAERRWSDAADLAERASELDQDDRYVWELLASSRFLQDDLAGALRAWNRIGKPLINLVDIDGLAHAKFQTIAAVMGLQPNRLLTERAFQLASRRLQELPDRSAARLTFRPEADGFVTVTAAIAERRGPPRNAIAWAATGLQTAIDREARVSIPGSTGQAELWSASWRWWDGRPRIAVGLALPRTGRLRGVWRVDGSWESQAYAATDAAQPGTATFDETRSRGALTVTDWLAPDLRYSLTAGVDRWRGSSYAGRTAFAGGSIERRWWGDRFALSAAVTAWAPARFHTSAVRAAYRSSFAADGWVFLADAGVARASDSAPLALWPGAGDGHSRDLLMRAHPLLTGGAVDLTDRTVFGRAVTYTHGEAQRWLGSVGPLRAAVATFADVARASRRGAPFHGQDAFASDIDSVTQVDVGAGLRLKIPGAAGTMRVDIAHGLRDDADALTVGWQF